MGDGGHGPELVPRLCHIVRWSDFNGYGFNLHAEKGKAGQFIGKVDEGSPAEAAGLKAGDRIVEVNGTNIGIENHQQVVGRIRAGGDETRLLVVDQETDQHYKEEKRVVRGDLPEVKFLTAARDEDIAQPQMEDSIPAAMVQDTNGADPEPELQPEPEPQMVVEDSSQYAPRLCNLVKWPDFDGYGFNLHAEKDKPGQYIGLVDPDSPAELGGLKEGDRIIEVNGDNIEKHTHVTVIQKIKSGGDKTSMLVVDRATDDYFKSRGQTICSSMTSVVVISTPSRNPVGTTLGSTMVEQQEASQVASYQWDSPPPEQPTPAVSEFESTVQEEVLVSSPPEDTVQWGVEGDATLPEPSVDLSDTEEATEAVVAAVVAEQVESAPEPEEPQSFNGTEEVSGGMAALSMTQEMVVDTPHTQEEEEEVVGGGGVEYHAYEEVEVSAPTPTTTTLSYQEDLGTASNGINGGAVEESRPEAAVKAAEPEPAMVHTSTITVTDPNSDLNLNLSAAEMKERLKSRKKQDPRQNKTSFETKYKMFEKM